MRINKKKAKISIENEGWGRWVETYLCPILKPTKYIQKNFIKIGQAVSKEFNNIVT